MILKKIFSSVLALCIICSSVFVAYAAENAADIEVEGNIKGYYGEEITVPVSIKNNPGIMGYRINISYDNTKLEIASVSNGSIDASNLNDSINGNTGEFFVLWNYVDNVTQNGVLFNINFNVITTEEATTTIDISYSQEDTFNSTYEDVAFNCKNAFITLNAEHIHKTEAKVVAPTCEQGGYTEYSCTECDYKYITDLTSATGHKYVISEVKEPTCTESGYTKYACSVCASEYTDSFTAPLGHKVVIDVAVPANCTSSGLTRGSHCSVCNEIIEPQYYVPVSHNWNEGVEIEKADCSKNGVLQLTCMDCGETKNSPIIATGHNYDERIIPPTCTERGYTEHFCNNCEYSYTDSYVACSDHKTEEYVTKATLSKDGKIITKCLDCDAVISTQSISKPSKIKLSKPSYTYDGKAKKPKVSVTDNKGNIISSDNYTVSYAKGRKNVGRYAVTITFKGNYSESKVLYFTIKPKATSISSITAAKKGFKVKWKKQTSQTTGYEIQYSTDKSFKKNSKTVRVSKNKKTTKNISKLSANKKYFVRVRTYKTVKVNGKSERIYSKWSKSRSVITKK